MTGTRRSHATLALFAILVLLTGCGSTAAVGDGNGTTTNHAEAVRFSKCMRSNGVSNFPDPDASGELTIDGVVNGSSVNTSAPAWQRAIEVCRKLEPSGFMGRKRTAQQQAAALKFAECMRTNGVPDFPDPTPDGPLIDTNRIPSAGGRGARSIPGFSLAAHTCTAMYSGRLGLRGR